jgi:hydrogenase maturation protein HypF
MCVALRSERNLDAVALTGGVFQNRTLSRATATALSRNGFRVFRHHAVPANDGGIALGQAVIGAARLAAGDV